jgi:hypothetical protein
MLHKQALRASVVVALKTTLQRGCGEGADFNFGYQPGKEGLPHHLGAWLLVAIRRARRVEGVS